MRFMVFVKMLPDTGPPDPALAEAMNAEMEKAYADGRMLDSGGLGGPEQTVELRLWGGEITTVDGPYAEAKEVVGGYSVIEAASQDEAVAAARGVLELHQEHWQGWEGSVEVRPIYGGPPEA